MVSERSSIGNFIARHLRRLRDEALYRQLRTTVVLGPTALVNGRKVIHLCSNDYLGLSRDKKVIAAATATLREISQSSSRLIAGNHPSMLNLEGMLANHRGTEAALVFPTGYSANLGVITALADRNTTIFSDELNHASIIDACRLSGADTEIFRHNDVNHLQELMQKTTRRKKIVVSEGVFSMDGDTSDLKQICKTAKDNDAINIVDDAHGDFIFGRNYSGIPSLQQADVDIHTSSLSKGLGCFGGYVASSNLIRELLVNTSRQFIYTSALPGHLCIAAMTAMPMAKKGNLQHRLQQNVLDFTMGMRSLGFVLGSSVSQIIPIMIGDERKALEFSQALLQQGVFAQAIRYPTVRKGKARLRVSITAMHARNHLDEALEIFARVGKKHNIV